MKDLMNLKGYNIEKLRKENRKLKEKVKQLQDQLDKDSSSISKKFMEDAIDEMYNEPDDPFTGF